MRLNNYFLQPCLYLHHGDINSIVQWTMPTPPNCEGHWNHIPARPTLFNHPFYLDVDIYPEGIADVVGYWAEDRIMGGVIIFDRRGEAKAHETQTPPPNVYFHASRLKVTWRPYQLRDEQQ